MSGDLWCWTSHRLWRRSLHSHNPLLGPHPGPGLQQSRHPAGLGRPDSLQPWRRSVCRSMKCAVKTWSRHSDGRGTQFSISLLQSIGSVLMWNLVLKSRVVLLLSICATTCSSSPEASPPSSSVTGSCLHCVAMVLCPMALCLKEGRAVDPVSKWSIRNTGYDVQTKYDTFQLYNSDVDFCWSDKSLNTILTKQWKQNLSEWK